MIKWIEMVWWFRELDYEAFWVSKELLRILLDEDFEVDVLNLLLRSSICFILSQFALNPVNLLWIL